MNHSASKFQDGINKLGLVKPHGTTNESKPVKYHTVEMNYDKKMNGRL